MKNRINPVGSLLLVCLMALVNSVLAGEIALTFDDAPRADSHFFTADQRATALLARLEETGVRQALFYVIARHLAVPGGLERIGAYTAAGHLLGNHSFSHQDPDRIDVEKYLADFDRAHDRLSPLAGFVAYYRFPFLHEGREIETRDQIRSHLSDHGNQHGYVTVDNYDWYLDHLLQKGIEQGKQPNLERLRDLYVELMWESIQFYDGIAQDTLGRSPRHVLLLHENDLAALFIGDLVRHLKQQGWTVIDPLTAYQDPIARQLPDTLFNGQGRVAAIARTQGVKPRDLIHPSEDEAFLERLFVERKIFE